MYLGVLRVSWDLVVYFRKDAMTHRWCSLRGITPALFKLWNPCCCQSCEHCPCAVLTNKKWSATKITNFLAWLGYRLKQMTVKSLKCGIRLILVLCFILTCSVNCLLNFYYHVLCPRFYVLASSSAFYTDSLALSVFMLQYWTDIYLSWNPESYPGVQNLRFPSNLVWVPDILLYNR